MFGISIYKKQALIYKMPSSDMRLCTDIAWLADVWPILLVNSRIFAFADTARKVSTKKGNKVQKIQKLKTFI